MTDKDATERRTLNEESVGSGQHWTQEDVQRVLYTVVRNYEQAQYLGGDSELLRDSIRIATLTLKDNGWWPND